MRTRSLVWGLLVLLCVTGAWFLWHHGNRSLTQKQDVAPTTAATRPAPPAPVVAGRGVVNTHPAQISLAEWNTNRYAGRLSNTTRAIGQLVGDRRALLLANALIDTTLPLNFVFPKNLQPQGDPGAYIVQARGPIDNAFRAMLAQAGATIIAYIPNDAYLVRASANVAGLLGGNPQTQAVVPYEPYYKIQSPLLPQAVRQMNLPDKTILNLGLFADDAPATTQQIEKLGGQVVGRDQSPFGPVVRVQLPAALAANWTALATLSGVQIVEPYHPRAVATDLSRATVGVAADSVTATNYLNLTGSNVLVEVNDTGIDALHPDLTTSAQYGRAVGVIGDALQSLVDTNGHGTHVAGIIAGDGTESTTVTNAPGSTLFNGAGTNFQFRGMAPGATLYSVGGIQGGADTNIISDQYFQEVPALTNALISNNSWVYEGVSAYDLAAASYDAAVRDALPFVTGSQPVLFVFAAGNAGNGGDDSDFGGGIADSIESPATAKDVITVGAIQEQRNITNVVSTITANADGSLSTNTSQPWKLMTSTSYRVAGFSSRGNVGIGLEGTFGRYKPDVVAPGTFIISTRSEQWDIGTYFYQSPTNDQIQTFSDIIVQPGSIFSSPFPSAPTNAVQLVVDVFPNAQSPFPFPNLPILAGLFTSPTFYDFVGANDPLFIPGDPNAPANYLQQIFSSEGFLGAFNYAVSNNTANPISFDVLTDVITTNSTGDFFLVLSNLNLDIGKPNPASTGPGPYYRYETGTSMATPAVSGTLALMQEFYATAYGAMPSPAMLKAMLVNGARATGFYNFQAQSTINYEGWGLINLPDSLQPGITNQFKVACSTFIQDQNPTNALATGDSQTYFVTTTNALPLRVTLAWTDPPGDPAAAIKLVNNLVLVVTNYSNPTNPVVYYGNDFPASSTVNSPHATNTPPTFDSINNVQNVYLPVGAGTNFSVTVMGYRVNVNAVTAQKNNVVQDYALVISCGSGEATNVMTVTATPPSLVSNPTGDQLITYIAGNNQVLLNQFVGANTPLLGTNTIPFTPAAPEGFGPNNWQVTVGMTNQWHFYIITNTFGFSNAAFVVFNPNAPEPDTLAIPRMGVFGGTTENASRDADIDLYVTTDPSITNLNPAAIANCVLGTQVGAPVGPNFAGASLGRGTTEFVVDTNSQSRTPNVYYIGVKSEDQMAAEYGFISIFSQTPFSQMQNGNQVVNGLPVPVNIPDGSPSLPGKEFVFGIAIYPMEVGEVTVSNYIWHQNFGDLFGMLTLNGSHPDVLNNHDSFGNPPGPYSLSYDDSVDSALPGTRPSDGPGNLNNYIGLEGLGVWMLTEVDDSLTQTGSVYSYNLLIKPHQDLNHGITVVVPPNSFLQVGFVDVPPGATNLTVIATNLTGATPPLQLYVKFGSQPTTNSFDGMAIINNPGPAGPGGSVSLGPPLVSGRYFVGIFNPSTTAETVDIWAIIGLPFVPAQTIFNSTDTPIPILDDAVTTDSIFVPDNQTISGMDVAIAVAHPRISDLVFHLISPDGTRLLLMENRGATDPNGAGGIATVTTNSPLVSTFEGLPATNYIAGQIVGGWTVAANQVSVVTDPTNAYQGTNLLALANGMLSANLATVPGQTYTLTFAYRGPSIAGWWRGESNVVAVDSAYGNNGALVGGVSYTNGYVNQALRLDGTSGYVSVPSSPNLNIGTGSGVTIEGWINPFTPQNLNQMPVVEWDTASLSGLQWWLSNPSTSLGNLFANIVDTGGNNHLFFTGQGLISFNSFQHVALTYDKNSGAAFFYLNGIPVASTNFGNITPQTGPAYNLYFGKRTFSVNEHYGGLLDELSIYNRALSASEIQAINADGTTGKFDRNEFPLSARQSLAEAQISLNGVTTNIFGDNTTWQTYTVSFKANSTVTTWQIQGLEPGMLLDAASVVSVQTNYNYLVFTENTNLTTTPIKFAVPPFSGTTTVSAWYNSFDNSPTIYNLYSAGSYFCGGWHVDAGDMEVVTNGGWYGSTPFGTNNYFIDLNGSQAGTISTNIPTIAGKTYTLSFAYARNPNSIGSVVPSAQILINNNPLGTIVANQNNAWANLGWQTTSYVFTATSPSTKLTFQSLAGTASGVFLDAVNLAFSANLYYLPEQSLDTFDGLDALGTWTLEVQDDRVGATNPAPLLLSWQLRFNYVTTGTNAAGIPPGITATNVIPAGDWDCIPVNVPTNADFATNTLVFATAPLDMWFNPTNCPVGTNPPDWELLAASTGGSATLSLTSFPTNIVPGTTYFIGLHNTNVFAVTNGFRVDFHLILPPTPLTNGVPITNTLPASITLTGHGFGYYSVTVPTNADFATNRLLFATAPLNLWFNQTNVPVGTNPPDYLLITNATNGVSILSPGTTPPLVPGSTYYLAIQNTNGVPVTFGLQVDFHFVSTNVITGPAITQTNINGTNGFLLRWSGPTNNQYTIQWKTNLAPVFPWNTVPNPVINVTYTPTNGDYSWFDDGSLTGGWPPAKFYRVLANFIAAPITNSTPTTNVVVSGTITPLTVTVPAGVMAATNLLLFASGPVDVWFNQATQPTGNTNAGDVLMLSNVTSGAFVLTGSSVPPLVPGANYYLGVQSLGTSNVSFSFQVNFAYASTNPPSISSITVTNINGTNAVLLKWVAPTNYQFQVQWATNLAPAIAWHTISSVVLTWSGVLSPTNAAYGIFQYLDDGSQTGGWGPVKFYRLVEYPYATPIPQTLTIINTAIVGSAVRFQWVAPTNYQYQVLWTTNLGLPLASWSVLANPVLGLSNGVYTFTDTNQTGPATAPKFFRLLEH